MKIDKSKVLVWVVYLTAIPFMTARYLYLSEGGRNTAAMVSSLLVFPLLTVYFIFWRSASIKEYVLKILLYLAALFAFGFIYLDYTQIADMLGPFIITIFFSGVVAIYKHISK